MTYVVAICVVFAAMGFGMMSKLGAANGAALEAAVAAKNARPAVKAVDPYVLQLNEALGR